MPKWIVAKMKIKYNIFFVLTAGGIQFSDNNFDFYIKVFCQRVLTLTLVNLTRNVLGKIHAKRFCWMLGAKMAIAAQVL